jgi:hypothetical protein
MDQKQPPTNMKVFIHHTCQYGHICPSLWREIDECPQILAKQNTKRDLPLHVLLKNRSSSLHDALLMIKKYPAAVEHPNRSGHLPLYIELSHQCRSEIIGKCIELYPDALTILDQRNYLFLHTILRHQYTSIDVAFMVIENYPAAMQRQDTDGNLPLHVECMTQCRLAIILKCIEIYPEALAMDGLPGELPLHKLLSNQRSSIKDALMLIDQYPAALQHQSAGYRYLPLHLECMIQCRSLILSKCIELYPESLAKADYDGQLPLHRLLSNKSSTIPLALMLIEKYPTALQYRDCYHYFPFHIECKTQCREPILSYCIKLYPEALDDRAIRNFMNKVNKNNFQTYSSVILTIFTMRSTSISIYDLDYNLPRHIRLDADLRRRIFNLLAHHLVTPIHEVDYRDLNWQPRAAMMMLLSQIQIQQQQQRGSSSKRSMNTSLAARTISDNIRWHQQRYLLLHIIKASTLLSNQDVEGRATSQGVSMGILSESIRYIAHMFTRTRASYISRICQHDDLGDILLRSVLGYL